MATFKGCTVKAGVKWTIDKKTITITCYPSKSSKPYKLTTQTWKNYCPFCKKSGILSCHGNCKGKWGVEGQIYCTKCRADFCGTTGKDAETPPRKTLTKASKSSDTATSAESKANDKKTALAEVKKSYKESSVPKKDFKLTLPPLKGIREGTYIELKPPLVPKAQTFFIGSIDTAQDDMQLVLYDKVPSPGSEYNEKTKTNNATSSAAKTIEKKIKLKGKQLKSISAIYKWLRHDGGSGGWKYKWYKGHKKGENENKFAKNSALWCWNNKTANCVDFAWIFYTMCKGAGIKVNIIQGKATLPDGTWDHMWNKAKNGKIYDCSVAKGHCKKYVAKKKVK